MAIKIKRLLIPLFFLLILISASQTTSASQAPTLSTFLPLITYDPTGWIGPHGGTVVPIVFDPIDTNIVYAGTFGSGVYKSFDGGKTWLPSSRGMDNLYVNSLAIDPSKPAILFAGTYKSQLYKSEDGGSTWVWSGTGMQDAAIVYSIAVDPFDPSIIYAATRGISNNGNPPWSGVLYQSTDRGATWQPSLQDLGGMDLQDWVYSVTVNPHAHNQVYIASHENGLFRSTDYGDHWQAILNGIHDFSGRAIVIAPGSDYPVTCFYGVWHDDTVFKSTDGCTSWIADNQGIPSQHVYSISINPINPKNVFLATFRSGILKTIDGGSTWQPGGLPMDDIYTVAIDPGAATQLLASTSGDGIYRSEDSGNTWQHSSTGIDNAMVTSVVFSPTDSDSSYASLFGGGVVQHDTLTNSWDEISSGLTDRRVWDLVMDPAHPGLLYALTDAGGLFKNDLNTGNGWIISGTGLPLSTNILPPAYPPDHPFATLEMQEALADQNQAAVAGLSVYAPLMKLVFSPSSPQNAFLATGGAGVYYSNNGGQNWQVTGLRSGTIVSLAVDYTSPSVVYAATNTAHGVLASTDGGKNWSNTGLPLICYTLFASPVETGVLYAGTSDGIYRYQAGTWTPLGLSGHTVTALQIDPTHPNRIFAGTDTGGYYSLDDGQTWTIAHETLVGQTIDAITLNPTNTNLVYFSTKTHGIFLLALHL